MPAAWTCEAEPARHGSFLQLGLDNLSALYGALQPRNRYGCPICLARGLDGWMRAASEPEAARIAAEQGV